MTASHLGFRRVRNGIHTRQAGFTLIEVMIVIAIILLLAGLVGVTLFKQKDEAKAGTVQIQMRNIESALKEFRRVYDRWPNDDEGISVLWDQESLDPEAPESKWKKFLEKPVPNDGWGNEWGYRQVSENGDEDQYDLWSFGPDGEEATEDDITSWVSSEDGSFDDFGDMDTGGMPDGGGN